MNANLTWTCLRAMSLHFLIMLHNISTTSADEINLLGELQNVLISHSAYCLNLIGNFANFNAYDKLPVINYNSAQKMFSNSSKTHFCPFQVVNLTAETKGETEKILDTFLERNANPEFYYTFFMGQEQFSLLAEHELFSRIVNLVVFISKPSTDRYNIYTNHFSSSSKARPILLDFWNGSSFAIGKGKRDVSDLLFPQQKLTDLDGRKMKASAVDFRPFSYLDQNRHWSGIEAEMAKALAKSVNAEMEIGLPTSGSWGDDIDGKGNYNGILGDLQHRRADLGFGQLFIKQPRTLIMDYTQPYDTDYDCFLAMKPQPLPQFMALVRPFDAPTWVSTLATLASAVAFLSLHVSIYPRRKDLDMSSGILYFVSVLFTINNEYLTRRIRSYSMRVFCALFLVPLFVLSRGYAGALMSFLTVPLVPAPLDTIKEVAESGLPVGSYASYSTFIMHLSKDPWIIQMRPRQICYNDKKAAFANFSRNHLVLYQSRQYLEFSLRTQTTSDHLPLMDVAHIASECTEFYLVSLGLPKRSVFKTIFDRNLQRFKEAGMILKWTREGMAKASENKKNVGMMMMRGQKDDNNNRVLIKPLTMEEVKAVFALGLSLFVPCSLVLIVEVIVFRVGKRRSLVESGTS